MLKVKALFLAVSMVPFALGAQNLIKNGDAESNLENWSPDAVQIVTENPQSGKSCFKNITQEATASNIIPVDGTKTYKYSGWFKSADDKTAILYLGLLPLDANKVQINSPEINLIEGTETELAEDCKAEDTVLKAKDASKWKLSDKTDRVAFNILPDYKDLPNKNLSPVVNKTENKNNVWELTLDKPCGRAYPAGTKIRQHKDSWTYIYPAVNESFRSAEWMELTGEIKGMATSGAVGKQFWPGTKYVKIIILTLTGSGKIYFDDLKLEEQK
ncbi:MAG: hypothetical protein NT118_10960 [Lentisphaerae bacterium]|nr:hypothetical protein [Lentisphaerota bacterium]